jgi:PAS domain S-box-containing protein
LRFDLLNQNQRVTSERLLRRQDGTELPIEMTSVKLPDGRYQAILRDIRPRLAWEQSLREAERRYRDLFNNTPDNLFRIAIEPDGGFRLEDVNPAQGRALGLEREAMIGKRLEELLPPPLFERISENYRRCIASGENLAYQEVADLPQGRTWFETLLVPIREGSGEIHHLVGFSRNITERKSTEEALLQASKMESLGVLAGGIAHDFNNLLAAILGNLNLAQEYSEGSPARPFLETAEKTVLRASDLTRQMLAYSGKGRFVVMPLDVNQVVCDLTQLLQVSISKRIRLNLELAPAQLTIEADAAQVQQVIMNLVTNASDAIGDQEGVITLRTEARELDERQLVLSCPGQKLAPGGYVVVEVVDDGCGMTPEVQARIFDPFFSTKATGRGLGLSALLGILRGHGAGLKITSEPGRGSTFQILFPASLASLPELPRMIDSSPPGFSGTALVVDDEPTLRNTASAALQSMGFQVLAAEDGEAALACYQRHSDVIRLVLMDLTMPRMGGLEASEVLHRLDPGLPIILSSGYSEQEALKPVSGGRLAGFLQKPYTIPDLHRLVAKVLQGVP